MVAQHLLQHILRHPLRAFGIEVVLLGRGLQRILETADFRAVEPRGEDDIGGIIDGHGRSGAEPVGDAPATQMFARACIGGLGARIVANPVVALDNQAGDAARAQLNGRCQANRASPNDQNVDV